ncbi:hypothetical protein G7Y79_00015g038110 [Physcia stellaris]|nr:hypothetical protein G7Y79_00015g038110 [Physcia stellaris]
MSYYFSIINTRDAPLFELEFGTSKAGGDGVARFSSEARAMNPFIVHSSLDIVDEARWSNNAMYLKRTDQFSTSHISTFLTPTSIRFMLLHLPHPPNVAPAFSPSPGSYPPFTPYTSNPLNSLSSSSTYSSSSTVKGSTSGAGSIANNPTSPQTEEAIRLFFWEVFEGWIKATMNPFQGMEAALGSPVFRARVQAAGRKYL